MHTRSKLERGALLQTAQLIIETGIMSTGDAQVVVGDGDDDGT